jgi:mannitol 2-dehydrogenase
MSWRSRRQAETPLAFLTNRDLFGDLIDEPRFTVAYEWTLRSLHERGARATLHALVGESR